MNCKLCDTQPIHRHPELDDAIACVENGEFRRALELTLPIAMRGDVKAQCLVGGLYQSGLGGEVDIQAALNWLHQAGEQGGGLAWHNLSTLYLTGGEGLEPNAERAREYKRRAIENGFDFSVEFPESWTNCYQTLLRK
jgi:uncharacterized protein